MVGPGDDGAETGTTRDGGVLIVEDEALIAMSLAAEIQAMGLEVCATAATARRAVELAERHRPRLVLMDVRLSGEADGVAAAMEMHRRGVPVPIVYVTGSREPETVARIRGDHPTALLFKPVLPDELRDAVRRALG
jgi:DNA-binding NarL/FixJ family response regulator